MHTIYITSKDNKRLRQLLILTPFSFELRRDLEFLRTELDRASIVADPTDRPTAIRIGSWFEFLDAQTGEIGAHTLCMPHEAPRFEDGLSVTSRFGTAVLGCCVGDEVRWDTAVGSRRILIRDVRQAGSACECEPAARGVEGAA